MEAIKVDMKNKDFAGLVKILNPDDLDAVKKKMVENIAGADEAAKATNAKFFEIYGVKDLEGLKAVSSQDFVLVAFKKMMDNEDFKKSNDDKFSITSYKVDSSTETSAKITVKIPGKEKDGQIVLIKKDGKWYIDLDEEDKMGVMMGIGFMTMALSQEVPK